MDLTLGLGAGGAIVAGIVVAGVGLYMPGIPKKAGKIIAALGLIFAFIGVAMMAGLLSMAPSAQANGPKAMYDVSYTEAQAWQMYDDDTNVITVAMSFNDTSDAFVGGTGAITGVFTIDRTDALIDDAVALGALGNVPSVDVTGASPEPIVAELADHSSNFQWTKASGVSVYEDVSVLVESGSSANVTLTVTLNADAVAAMSQYEWVDVTFSLAGQNFEIHCIKATVST